jgi:subtilase family serine protease
MVVWSRRIAFVGLLVVGTTSLASAQQSGAADGVLPDFDIRLGGPGRQAMATPEIATAIERLRVEQGDDSRIRTGSGGRVRTFTARSLARRAPAQAVSPERGARQFLERHLGALGLDAPDLATLEAASVQRGRNDPLTRVTFRQRMAGLEVYGAALRAHVTADGQVALLASTAASGRTLGDTVPALEPEDALHAALRHAGAGLADGGLLLEGPAGPERRARFERGRLESAPEARLVLFPLSDGLRLAWLVTVAPPGPPQKYDVIVDAQSGALLYRRNRVLYTDGAGRVLQSDATQALDARLGDAVPLGGSAPPPGGPAAGCPPAVNHLTRDLVTPFRDQPSVLGNTGRLQGNNAAVFRGAAGLEGAAGSLQPDGSWLFDFGFGSAGSAETHLFFLSNYLHDFFYDLGFDEAAGNFQADNFGRGGAAGDRLVVVARADGRNNATFEPKPDGQSPEINMFLWDGDGCWSEDVDGDGLEDLDGAFDSDIMIHEFHHGVSTRLNPDFTGPEADAMGEGGSDFFAYSINGDTTLAEYAAPPFGIRRVNGRTYGSWWCFFGFYCAPHDNGEIWANLLWDLRERFRADAVDGSEAAGIHAAHLLYVDGLKLSPPSPTMLDMRDAMIEADRLRRPSGDPGGSVNACRTWEVFALRGMGAGARDTNDTGLLEVAEDFTVPPECPALPPPATVTLTATDATASEAGAEPGVFTVTRSGDTSRALTVYFDPPFGTAVETIDFPLLPSSVVVPAGSATATVTLTPIDDTKVEANETVTWLLSAGPGYRLGAPASALITIISDDVAPDLTVTSLTGPGAAGPGDTVTVNETTRNIGTDAVAATVTRYFLSLDALVDGTDTLLGARSVPPLAIGASSSAAVALTLPVTATTGTYYLVALADATEVAAEIAESNNVRALRLQIGPDLLVASFSAPATAAAGTSIAVTESTRNQGGSAAGPSSTGFFLSSNPVLDAADLALGSRPVPALGPGGSHTAVTSLEVPATTTAGVYYLIATADGDGAIAEVVENNNLALRQLRVGADLMVATLTVPGALGAGLAATLSDTTRNQGGGPGAASVTRFFLSADITVDPGDAVLGDRNVPALGAGASSVAATLVTIPADTAVGTYYVIAQADAGGEIEETTETNNQWKVQVRVGPDLDVTAFSAPATASAGASLTVTASVKNLGGAPAAASALHFHLSADAQLDASDQWLASRAVPALAAGVTDSGSSALNLPASLTAGYYYLLARADGAGEVAETNETNNVAPALIRVGADLIVSAAAVTPLATGAGALVTVTDTTRNTGGGIAPASTTRFYLSLDAVLDGTDTPLGQRAVPALAAGVSHSASTPLTIPATAPTSLAYLIVAADDEGDVVETAETNNHRSLSLRIGPDLRVLTITTPAAVTAGGDMAITDTTRNQGGGAAGASTTRFVLSVNGTVDATDVDLGARVVPVLGPETSHTATTTVTVPAGTAPGRYYVLAVADAGGDIEEVFENNNGTWKLITVD